MRLPIILLFMLLNSSDLSAQPYEADIKSKLTNSNTLEIKFTKSTGTRQWNSSTGNWEYVRGVVMKQKSFEYPEYKVIIGGDAVYQYTGDGKYSYWKFRFLYQQFEGIPNPDATTIQKLISTDWKKFYGVKFSKITRLIEEPALAADPKWEWHTPKSVSFLFRYKASIIAGNSIVEQTIIDCKLRLYRDDPKGTWKSFIVADVTPTVLEKTPYTTEQIKKMEQQTLAYTLNEKTAAAAAAALPVVNLPEFREFKELADYVHQVLRTGNPERLEAVLVQTLAPSLYFVPGSTVQLNARGAQLINENAATAYKGEQKYSDQYCKKYKTGSLTSAKHIYITGCLPNVTTMISGIQVNAGYKNGAPVLQWKITNLSVTVRQDEDATRYLQSITDMKKICPDD